MKLAGARELNDPTSRWCAFRTDMAAGCRPSRIDSRIHGEVVVRRDGPQNVGKMARSAYVRTLAAAEADCKQLNGGRCDDAPTETYRGHSGRSWRC